MWLRTIARIGAMASLIFGLVPAAAQEPARPNIVLILADDVAFTDFGAYGSEINTPNIDALAQRGVLFTNFHATPMCAPSRAMLMTGVSSHRAGVGNLPETTPAEHQGSPAYRGYLAPEVPTIAERLQAIGYRTFMTGKWHLGHSEETLPSARGFDRTFILDATGGDNYEDRPYLPIYEEAPWYADGEPVGLPDDFYSSEFLVDQMIDFVGSPEEGEPFFAYVAFQAIHIPVQAPREFTMRYQGVYDDGWHVQRARRAAAAHALGVADSDAPIGPMHPDLRDWDALSDEDRAFYTRAMMVNAGMLEAMDYHLGRLIAHLRETGAYENTIFIVTSDNGPEAGSPLDTANGALSLWLTGYTAETENLGERGSFGFIGPEWASAAASPHALFKFHANEGGTRVPLIVAGPGVSDGIMARQLSLISDIPATIATLAGAETSGITGRSLVPALEGGEDAVYGPEDGFGIETAGRRAYYRGRYKIVSNGPPYGDNVWRLYDLENDPGETQDLAESEPQVFSMMLAEYESWAEDNGVLETPEGYEPIKQLVDNSRGILMRRYWWVFALAGLVIVAPIALLLVYRRRRKRRATA